MTDLRKLAAAKRSREAAVARQANALVQEVNMAWSRKLDAADEECDRLRARLAEVERESGPPSTVEDNRKPGSNSPDVGPAARDEEGR
jgi:predicted phage gp36 major capsid-like protein